MGLAGTEIEITASACNVESVTICTKADCSPPIHHNGFHAIAINDDFNKFYSVRVPYRSSIL